MVSGVFYCKPNMPVVSIPFRRCPHCQGSGFRSMKALNAHIQFCQFQQASTASDTASTAPRMTMDIRDQVLRTLVSEITHLRTEVATLRTAITSLRRRQQPSILAYLSTLSPPLVAFRQWFNDLQVSRQHLEEVIRYGLVDGLIACILTGVSNHSNGILPVVSFSARQRTLFVYDASDTQAEPVTGSWVQLMPKMLESIVKKMTQKMLAKFNRHLFETEDETLTVHFGKFLPPTNTCIQTANVIISKLYDHVRTEISEP